MGMARTVFAASAYGYTIAVCPFRPSMRAHELEVTVLDVGQGDSILVVSPKGSALLIDGGGAFEGFRGREEHLRRIPEKRRCPRICGRAGSNDWMWWR